MVGLGRCLLLPGDSAQGLSLQQLHGSCPIFPAERNTTKNVHFRVSENKNLYKVDQSSQSVPLLSS